MGNIDTGSTRLSKRKGRRLGGLFIELKMSKNIHRGIIPHLHPQSPWLSRSLPPGRLLRINNAEVDPLWDVFEREMLIHMHVFNTYDTLHYIERTERLKGLLPNKNENYLNILSVVYQFLLVHFRHSCTADTMSPKIVSLFSFVTCGMKNRQQRLTGIGHYLKKMRMEKMSNCEMSTNKGWFFC